jgi:hypothetical protein
MERLLLRPKMLEDLAAMHALLGDPELGVGSAERARSRPSAWTRSSR